MDAIDPRALRALYQEDETAWLEVMSRLAAERRLEELDWLNLGAFLGSLARQDRQDVADRLVKLLMHQLKWVSQAERRTLTWELSITEQMDRLREDLASSRTLRDHAQAILPDAYREAVKLAVIETGIDRSEFPEGPPASIDDILKDNGEGEPPMIASPQPLGPTLH